MNSKEEYKQIYKDINLTLFASPFWLDQVCGDDKWDVIIAKKGSRISGILLYFFKRKGFIGMPPLTPYMGPFVFYPEDMKYSKRLSYEHQVLEELIGKLPKFKYYNQRLHHDQKNWLPFYWNSFRQTTRYTYIISDLAQPNDVFSGFKNNVKRNIRKAENKFDIRSLKSQEISDYYEIIRKNRKPTYSYDFLLNLIRSCEEQNCGKTFAAFDQDNKLYACVFIVWDNNTAYYILGARNPDVQTQHAMSLIMWQAIKYVSRFVTSFDFEGSMIEPIERYFRTYGSIQQPYLHITKINSFLIKVAFCLNDLINRKLN